MSRGLFIGIDGGGTHSTAVAVRPDGSVAAVTRGGGMNYHNDGVAAVRRRLEEIVRTLCDQAEAPAEKVCVGMSALDGSADAETLSLFVSDRLPAEVLDLRSDAYAALMGFTLGQPGMIVICGTGSMLLLLDAEGRQRVSGGWGFLLGDEGSGYTLARDALMAVAAEADGVGTAARLTQRAMDYFGAESPRRLIDRVYDPSCGPDRIAGFARSVLEEAALGCPVSLEILRRNMNGLALRAVQLFRQAPGVTRTGLYGGIFAHSPLARKTFEAALLSRMPEAEPGDPSFPPELGAVIHLLRCQGLLTGRVLSRMKETGRALYGSGNTAVPGSLRYT